MANPLLTDEQNRRLANQNSTYNQIMQGFAPVQQPQEDSWLGGLSRGAKAGLGGVGAGLLHAGQAAFGTDGSLAAGLDAMAKNNAQRREWDLADTLSLDYLTNPEGLAYGLGQLAGSMALPALFGAGVAAAVPTGGTSLLGTGALIGAAGAAPMAISEGGNTYAQGLQQGMTEDEAKKAGLTDAAIKLPFYMLSEGLSGKVAQGLISKGLLNAEGKSLGRRAAESGAKILGNAANEAYEEGTENRSSAYALGDQRISSLGNIFNPFDWDEEDKAQAVGVFTPTLALGTLTGGAGHLRSRFDKKNSDVSEEIASEDGGTIEEAPEANVSGREAFINAIAGQESGGNYNAENGDTGAYGKYQILPSNWPEWAEEAGIGADAPRTPENQEIVARFKLGQYYDKYGARGAAIAWYGGEGALNYSDEALNRKQGDNGEYPSINEYADEVLGRMGNVADSVSIDDTIDDTEENYFDESNYTDDAVLGSLRPARGFDVSHLEDGTAQDRNSVAQFEKLSPEVEAQRKEFTRQQEIKNRRKQSNALMEELRAAGNNPQRTARYGFEQRKVSPADALAHSFGKEETIPNIDTQKAFDNKIQTNIMRKRSKTTNGLRPNVQFDEEQTIPGSLYNFANSPRDMANVTNFKLKNDNAATDKSGMQWELPQQQTQTAAQEEAKRQAAIRAIAEYQRIINEQEIGAVRPGQATFRPNVSYNYDYRSAFVPNARRALALQNNIRQQEQPSIEPTTRNGRALDERNFREITLPKVREQHKWDKEHKEYHAERYGESALPQTQLLSTDRAARRNMPKPGIEARSFINDRAEKKSARERMQDAIAFVWKDDPKHPLKACRRQLNMFRDMRKEYLQPIYDVMAEGAGNGVSRIPIIEFDNQHRGRFYRQSNNSPWYAKYFKEHKKKPTQKAMYDIAEEVAFGENADVGYYAGVQGKELEAIVAENHAQLDPINDYIQTYESLELRLKENPNYGKEQAERINKAEEARRAEKRNAGETASAESIQTEAKQPAESNQDEVNKKAVSVEENIANGKKAIERIIETHEDIENAMYRDDTGNIDFVWGREGTGAKFKHGYGLAHIIAKRNSENGNGIETAKKLVEVIAKGTKVERQESQNGDGEARLKIHYDGYTAVLSLSRDKNTWLLTGWEDNDAGSKKATVNASGEGYDSTTATTATPTLTRRNGETVASVTKSVAQPAENVKKINLPKGTTVDVSIVGDNSNIIQVKFNGAQGKGTGGIMGRAGYKWKSDKQVWQARKTEKAMDVAGQLGYTEEAKPQESARQQRLQESNERATQSLVAQNKDESVPGKRYTVRNKFFSVTILDGVIRVTDASKINPQDNQFNFSLSVEEYQRAAQNGNRLAGISKLLKAKIREGIENWIEESPNERTKEVRKQQNDEAQIVQATDEHFENAYPLIEKVLQKAGIEALDHQTLFERAKAKKKQGKQEYKYYLNARPADVGAVPKGFIRVDAEDKGGRYGAIYYDRQLNDTDVQQYELKSADDVEKEKAQKEALETVSKELLKSDKLKAQAKNNSIGDFVLAYRDAVDDYLAEHIDENPAYTKLLNNPEIADEFLKSESIVEKAYDKLKASDDSQDVVQSNKGNTNEGGNNNGIDITGKLSSNDTGSRRAENEIRTTSSSEESSGSNGQGSRTLEGQSGRNGNNGVPGSRTAVGGKTSISKGSEQVSAVRENPARSAELSGSVVDSLQEQPNVDAGSTDKIVESVADGRTDAADTVNQKVNEVVKENNLDRQRADRLRKTAKVMPFLSKIQFSNTDFVADRLADNGKQGVMITDGTGTGKTFSGLAVAKEMVEDGKDNILIVTPSDSVNNQWANAAKDFFGIELSKLDNIQDAGKGAVITTYANLGANDALIKRDWDLVICDESHYLMNNEQGEKTAALAKLRQLTLHPRELRARAEERILPEKKLEARRTIAQAAKLKRKKGQLKASEEAIVEKAEKLQKEKADELSKEERVQVEAQVKDWEQLNTTEKPKVMFMSATPFAYVPDIDYAEGYLFDYPKVEGGSYNQPGNGFQQFMIEHFGYHMRYNKLTKPDKTVDNAVMEVEFHEWLRKTGALTGHELEIDKDYNRGFLLVDQGVGKKIDEGFEFLRNNHDKYRELEGVLNKQFDSRRRNYLLESIKARESVPIIQQYLKAGKKVVVFYETNVERESFNPFKFTQQTKELLQSGENRWTSEEIQHEMDAFAKERPDLVNLNLDELSEPISIYREAFGDDAMFFNGRVSKNKRAEYVKAFNDDNSGKNLIFVQQDAGNAGISLHDTTGKHQRVLINIGIPRRPSYAIQIEGRIYRLGNKSNAIIRYLTTATNIENGLFAETVAGRASTAENLALGRRARGLRDSFKNAYQEIFDGTWEDRSPGTEGEDVGGKENDRNIVSTDSDYDRAKAFYFARGKKTAKNKAAEGVDYFATPEPVGYKMVQWAGLKDGDRVLEPSAGHGAISRFFSPNTDNTIIEPSSRLAPQAQMNTDNAKLINGYFEDLHIGNKYDAVTMNPPFGTGGKTAVEHVAKAFKHLRNGGRVIAIIPRGAMADKRFDAWYESDDAKDAHMVGEVLLPGVTFERAGTKVATRIVIIDKGGESQGVKRIDLSRINNINELFDNLESVEMPVRQTKQADAGTANFANSLRKGDAEGNSEVVTADSYKHTKTGEIIPSAKLNANLSDEEYRKVKSIADKNGGYYSRYAKAFLFQDNETGRDKFVEEVNGANNTQYSVYSEAVQRAKEEVEAEIRAAFPNGKVEYVNGVPTITMPNGSKFQYSIRENIVVNAKEQRKADAAHGTSGARVQGFWKKFTGNGVQRMLAVSQRSERGTAFHEAMHAAIDLVLTEKEKNALYNYYEKKAKEQNRDVDEVIADAYRDWVLARQRKSGTVFGKLWRKVKDFCTRIKAIFDKGAEVERIMQDIESGRVYERGTNNHSVTKRISFSKEEIQGQKGSGTTQVATTRTMYVKALKWLRNQSPEAKTVLDYGAGLGLGTDDMRSNNPDLNIDCYEPNPERWAGKQPPTYTNNTQINKDYDLILNTNVLNVVEKPIRDLIVKDIADHLTMGGKALITTRGWSNDVNAAKNFKPADEHHAIWINKGKNGYVFQKGFDGDELKNYIEELLGDEFVVEKTRPTFGKSSVTITRVKDNASDTQNTYSDTESINPNEDYIQGINDTDAAKVNTLAKSFEDKGYVGRPVVLVENGNEGYIAVTGSHRIEAAKQADVDLKAIVLENNEDTAQLIEARDDDERANIAKQLYEEGVISKSAYDVIREEADNNYNHYSDTDAYQEMPDSYKTLKGSVVKRSKYGVGKQMGSQVYLHKDYVSDVIPKKVWENALKVLSDADSDFEYNCVMYDTKTGNVRFDEAPDFDESREPIVGDTITVKPDGTVKHGHSNYIWHHKWLWVKNDYQGFDVNQSKAWSNKWLGTLTETADGNGIERWNTQLDRFNLEHDGEEVHYSVAPAQHKIANAFTNTERKGTIETAKDFIKEGFKDFRAHWLDKNDNLRKFDEITQMTGEMSLHQNVQNIPATAAGLLKSVCEGDAQSIKAANQHLKNVKMKHNVTLAMALNEINKDVMDKAHPKYLEANGFDSWQNAFGAYLGVERELEMSSIAKAQGETYKFSKGLTEAECRNFVANAPVQFRKAADMFYKVNDNVISIMEDAQVFSHDVAKALRTKHRKYCPLLRDFSDTAAADNFIGGLSAGGRGVGNVSIPLKAISIKGSERGVLNPLETVLKSYAMMINRAERNKVGLLAVKAAQTKQLHDLIKEVPEVVGKDGKVVNAVADPKNCIFTVLVNGKKKAYQTTQELYSPIVGYNLPAAGLTLEVARMTAQMLRTGATMSPSFIIRNLLRDTITAGFSSKNGFIPFVDTWRGFMALKNDPALRAEFEAAGVGEFNFYGAKAQRIKSLDKMIGEHENLFKRIFGKMEEWSDIAESATRMGEFMLARKAGKSLEQAGHEAREVTVDFSKSGIYGEQINRYIPFFNACLQGGDKIYQLMREDPHGTMMKMFLTIVLPSALLYAFNRDEDWWKDLDPDIKNNYWCLSDKLRIPKPQEIGVLLGSGIEAFFEQASGRDKKAVSNVLDAFLDNMTPSIIPTLILPLVEWKTNYSYFRGQQLVSSKYQRLPDELQYNDYTSELSKGIGNVFKVSPMKVDNLVRGYTGTMGALLWGAAGEPFAKANNLPAKHFNEMLFVRDFNVTDANLSRPMNEFYGILDKANRQHAGYGVKGKPEAAVKGIRSAGSMISKIRKDIDKITHSNLTPERKRELIDKRKEKMNQIAKQANARYGKYFD